MYKGDILFDSKVNQAEERIKELRRELAHAKANERPDLYSVSSSDGIQKSPHRSSLRIQTEIDEAEKRLNYLQMFGHGKVKGLF